MIVERRAYLAFSGRRADGTRVAGVIPQLDGSTYASGNCGPGAEAHRDLVHMQGKRPATEYPWPPTGASIRKGTGDTSGGTTPYQTTAVSRREYGIPRDIRVVSMDEAAEWLSKRGSLNLLIKYAAVSDAGYSGSPGFRGSHIVPLAGWRDLQPGVQFLDCDSLYDGRRAGIPMGPHWIPATVLTRAAGDLDLGDGATTVRAEYGPNMAMVSFGTRLWTPPPPEAKVVLRPGARKLVKPRIYRPRYVGSWLRRGPGVNAWNRIGRVDPSTFRFAAYQFIDHSDGRWVGNTDGSAWMFLPGLVFVRYI